MFKADLLAGKSALVTGASSGLGEHFAQTLARHGAHVIIAARRVEKLEALAARIVQTGGMANAVALDVRDGASVSAAVAEASRIAKGLDILVNNSGVANTAFAIKATPEEWNTLIDTNLTGAFRVAQAFAQQAAAIGRKGCSIINIASVAALRVAPGLAGYCASKAGLLHLTEALAGEWARLDIRVNAICPGYFITDMNRAFFESEKGRAMVDRIPTKRLGELADLDGPLLLLASEASRHMTGSALKVDGGHAVSAF
jgi:NAD(P)-dependent dehydrogenase (short-subunit alcohol dehydrogenase family)